MAATTKKEKCRNSDCAVSTCLVMCFCGLDVLIMVEFISKDINFIAKKKKSFLYFPCPQIL